MQYPALSPTFTASSTSTAAQSLSTDVDMMLTDKGVQDFSEMFNFDDFDSSSLSHSPTTISSNHTPSPLPLIGGLSPYAVPFSPSYDFPTDFSFDFPIEQKVPPVMPIPVPQPIAISIKHEPMEFPFGETSSASASNSSQSPIQPDTINFNGLAAEQQFALQQLMTNILAYQQQFGVVDPSTVQAPPPQQTTIEPSMVFSMSSNASTSTSASLISPTLPAPPLVAPSQHDDPEPLRSIREESTYSSLNEDVDSRIDRLVPLPAIFNAGRGKGGKKGGGMSSVVRGDDEDIDDDDLWRPSPEEYKKLSSKEKRQLRNKLSARAFRTRRKDYIGTLEAHIKDRDTVIDAIHSELISSRSESHDLRRELDALRSSTMSILHPESAHTESTAPALMSALAMSPSLPAAPALVRRTPTPVFNRRKDLPASLESSRGFWGGNDNRLGGGSTICHTMFTPDLVLPATPLKSIADLPRVNLNPRLNETDSRMPALGSTGNAKELGSTFSDWSENNAFTLRSMDSYRMQMWSRLAREAAADKSSLTNDLRPKFYVERKATTSTSTTTSTAEALSQTTAATLASAATIHITSKLASSFWSAFSGSGLGSGSKLDTEKLVSVVMGTSRLKVVEVNEKTDEADHLVAALGGLRLQTGSGSGSVGSRVTGGEGLRVRENPLAAIGSFFKIGTMA